MSSSSSLSSRDGGVPSSAAIKALQASYTTFVEEAVPTTDGTCEVVHDEDYRNLAVKMAIDKYLSKKAL